MTAGGEMEFEQEAHWELYNRTRALLEHEFLDVTEWNEAEPAFMLHLNRIPLLLSIGAAGPSRASITFMTQLAPDTQVTLEIAEFLLHTNHDLAFGKLGLDDDTITFSHMVMGEGLPDDSLTLLIHLLADAALRIDDELTRRFT